MPLYQIQDDDRPMWVIAPSFQGAIDQWVKFIAIENEIPQADVEGPTGVIKIADDSEIVGSD